MKNIQFIGKYVLRYKWQYLIGMLFLFAVDFISLLVPKLIGMVTDGLTTGTLKMPGIMTYIGYIVITGIAMAVGRFLWRYFLILTARKLERDVRDEMFGHLETLDAEYFNEHKTGTLMAHFTNDLNAVRTAVGPGVISVFDATIMTIMVIIQMMIYVDFKLTILAVIPMFFIMGGMLYYGDLMEKRFKHCQEAFAELTDFTQESISGVRVVKAFVREEDEKNEFAKYNAETRKRNLHVIKLQAVVIPLLSVVIGISMLVTLLYGGYLALIGEITLGRFVAFNQYIGMLVWPMLAAGDSVTMFSQGYASVSRIRSIFSAKPEIFEFVTDEEEVEEQELGLSGGIEFRHLTFTHKGAAAPSLKDINLKIPQGTTVAVIGRTGSGKTTLVNLLQHLYQVEPGMIFVDGRDINTVPLKELRGDIAYVPQDNFLFSDSLRNNIAFGVEGNDMDHVIEAARAACIHENIEDFPQQYNTIVGERGVTLSGGQKQRSSIARAFMKNSPIMIMDDSLSAVDTDTEEKILENLKENRKNKTTIIIAHRISTIQNADLIMVLEEGALAECGNHAALMKQNGIYKGMFEKQQLEARNEGGKTQ
ncbi:MAG: ABC transporter ATP-binding protein [Lachnospiraceae bacterium]